MKKTGKIIILNQRKDKLRMVGYPDWQCRLSFFILKKFFFMIEKEYTEI